MKLKRAVRSDPLFQGCYCSAVRLFPTLLRRACQTLRIAIAVLRGAASRRGAESTSRALADILVSQKIESQSYLADIVSCATSTRRGGTLRGRT